MLVKDQTTLKKHVTAAYNFAFTLIEPYIRTQERKHIKSVIGRELYNEWAVAPIEGPAKDVYELLQEASANLAMLNYTHVGLIHISSAGFFSSTTENATPATWGQIKDLRRKLLTSGNQAIDEALEIMEDNETDFPKWANSRGYTRFKEFFVRKTGDFQRYYNIENSRLTFLRLRPHLLKVEDKYFDGLLGTETTTQIKEGSGPEEKQALQLCQAAQVSLCVSELAHEGAFAITPNGLVITSDETPGEKYNRLSERELDNFCQVKLKDGNEYLKKLLTHLRAFPETFEAFANKESVSATSPAYNTKSTLSF